MPVEEHDYSSFKIAAASQRRKRGVKWKVEFWPKRGDVLRSAQLIPRAWMIRCGRRSRDPPK
jgi:hypothetical protein